MLYLILLLPFLLGIGCAFCKEENARRLTPVLAAAQTVLTALVIYAAVSGKDWATNVVYLSESLTFSLKMDGVAAVFAVVTAVCWLLTIPYAAVYMPHSGGEPRFYVFLFTTEAVLLGTALAADMVTLYLFYELTTLCSAPLVLHELKKKAIIGAYKYLFYSVGGAFVALFGVVVLYFHCDSLSFAVGGTMTEATPLTLAAVFCMILGFGAKAGLFPLHNWLPDAHSQAPSLVSALLSGALLNCAFLGILRGHQIMLGAGLGGFSGTLLVFFGLVSMFVAAIFIVGQGHYKRMLAYSSVEHMGILALAVGLGGAAAFGGMLHAMCHSLTKCMLFLLAGNILARYHTYSSYDVHGLRWTMPVTGALWMGGFLAIVGSPPFGLFVSEFLILKGILQQGQWLVAALYMLALAIIFVGMSVAVLRMFQGTRPTDMPECPRESALSVLPPMALGLCVLLLGFWMPDGVEKLLRASAALIGG